MILQVGAHAGQRMKRRNACGVEHRSRPDARQLKQLRRADGPGRQQHFATRADHAALAAALDLHTGTGSSVEAQPQCLRAGEQRQVRSPQRTPQEGLGGIPAHAGFLVHVEIAAAEVAAAVEVVVRRNALLGRRGAKRIEDLPAHAGLLDAPFVAGAVQFVGAAVVVLVPLEQRQHVIPAPARIGAEAVAIAPAVVVLALAAHVDHAVDRRAAAQHPAARIADAAAIQARLGRSAEAPVGARVADAVQVADRHMNPDVVVAAARFEQRNPNARIGAQPVGEQAAGCAGADDHHVEDSEFPEHPAVLP